MFPHFDHPFFRHGFFLHNGCLQWRGELLRGVGVSEASVFGRYACDLAYRIVRGPIPDGMHALPTCGTRGCIHPFHSKLVERGVFLAFLSPKAPKPTTTAKRLTQDQRAEVVSLYKTGRYTRTALASRFGVPFYQVSSAIMGDPDAAQFVSDAYDPSNQPGQVRKLTGEMVVEMRQLRAAGASVGSIARRFRVSHTTAKAVVERRSWKHLP